MFPKVVCCRYIRKGLYDLYFSKTIHNDKLFHSFVCVCNILYRNCSCETEGQMCDECGLCQRCITFMSVSRNDGPRLYYLTSGRPALSFWFGHTEYSGAGVSCPPMGILHKWKLNLSLIDTFHCLCSRQLFENMATKEEIAQNKQFLLLSPCFQLYSIIVLSFKGIFCTFAFSKSSAANLRYFKRVKNDRVIYAENN